jgi:hypothetical protein
VSGKVHIAKHVVALRSARDRHWVAPLAGASLYQSERIVDLLRHTVAASDVTNTLRIQIDFRVDESRSAS